MVALGVTSMLFAVSRGAGEQDAQRRAQVKQAMIQNRLNSAIRSAKMVLAQSDTMVVLWTADLNANDQPNLAELHRIEWDSDTNKLWSNQAPDSLSEADNTEYDLDTTNFAAVTAALAGSNDFPDELWATDMTDWRTRLDAGAVQDARLISYDMAIQSGKVSKSSVSAATLRTE